jgi:hypothetical protein
MLPPRIFVTPNTWPASPPDSCPTMEPVFDVKSCGVSLARKLPNMKRKRPRLMPAKFTEPSGTSHIPPRLQICKFPFNWSPMFLRDALYSFAFNLSSAARCLSSIFCCLASSFAFCFNAARSTGGKDLGYFPLPHHTPPCLEHAVRQAALLSRPSRFCH